MPRTPGFVSDDVEGPQTQVERIAEISPTKRKWLVPCGVILLLIILLGQLAYSVKHESLSWDEGDHLFAGYMSLKHGDFGLNPEHPPLVKMVAALPLLAMHLHEPQLQNRYFKTEAYLSGRDLIFGNDFETIIFSARMAASLFALLLALMVFLTAREMFGTGAGFLALTLVVFEPNLLAHGAMVTTDTAAAFCLLATILAFYRYVKAPSTRRMIVFGLAVGVFAISKHSAVLLFPMILLLSVAELVRHWYLNRESSTRFKGLLRVTARFAVVIVVGTAIAVAIMWTCYGFRYEARPAGWQMNPRLEDTLHGVAPSEAKLIAAMAHKHLLPESYLYGLADVRSVANSWPSYIFGKVYAHGVWFYFPVAFLLKATVSTLVLLLITGFAVATGKFRCWREMLFLTLPPAIYLYVSMTSKLNIGVRHILLVFMFALVLAAGGAWALIRSNRRWAYVIAALVAFHIASSLHAFPTSYMAYANELWGGPAATHKYLTDSNTDWGQQLKATKRYLDQRGVKQCWFAYFVQPAIPFEAYGVPCKPLPTLDSGWFGLQTNTPEVIEGPVLISHSDLTGYEWGSNVLNPYRDFQQLKPTAIIEHGIWVFDGTFKVPYMAAMDLANRSSELLEKKQPEAALLQAQKATALAPNSMQGLMAEGEALNALGRGTEARPVFEKALALARTMEPSAQEEWIPRIERKLSELK